MIHELPPHSLRVPLFTATARVYAGAFVAVALGANAALAGELSFSQQIIDDQPLASDRVNDIAVADIDGDGKLDIWLSGRDGRGHQAAWYRNPGERGGPWKRYPFAEGSWKYGDLGDLDGDGDIDLAAGYDLEKRLYWVENTGVPEHAPWPKHFLGVTGAPDQVMVRDLDGDGKVEVVALFKNGPIHILRRPPDARQLWLRTVIKDVPRGTAGGTVGDVDNDGDLDIVFGNAWYENPGPADDWIDGEKWKRRVVDARWPAESRSAVADIDGDGKNDLVLCAEESSEGAAWYRKGGGAASDSWTATPINRRPYEKLHSCQVADFDGDGKADVFVAEMHTSDARRVTVFLQGKDSSDWIEKIVATTGSHNAKVADIDGNGVPDIVGKNFEEDMRPRVWFAERGKGSLSLDDWKPHVLARRLPHQATFVRSADVNGDGRTDIIAGAWWWENPGAIGGEWKQREFGGGLKNVAVVHDFDGDGLPDVLGTDGAVRGGQFLLAHNRGGGRFDVRKVGPASRGDFLQGAVAGGLDGEGTQVVLSWHNGDRVSPKIGTEWLVASKTVTEEWKLAQLSEVTNEEEIALGDIDGDGRTDIHLGTHWLRNLGGGKFERRDGANLGEGEVDRLRLADVDGDGDLDVVIGVEDENRLVWAENRAAGGEWIVHAVAADFRHMSLDVRDIDGDGDVDIVSGAHKGRGEVSVYENLGRGVRWQPHVVSAGASGIDHHAGTQLVDLDGDGDLDILSIGWRNTSLTVYENLAIGRRRAP
jgi:hypothetical protein